MAMRKVKATIYTCDNCGSEQVITEGTEPPMGITIAGGYWDLPWGLGGGPIRKVFACGLDCIEGAVEKGMTDGETSR